MVKTLLLIAILVVMMAPLTLAEETPVDDAIESVGAEYKSGYGDVSVFGGPISVGAELKNANRTKVPFFRIKWMDELLEPWFEMKKKLHTDHGVSFGINYNVLTQWLTESDGESFATGGIFEFFGSWEALWRGTGHRGVLTWKVEQRHRLGTDVAPMFLGFEAGIGSLTGTKFTDYGLALTNFFWRQEFDGAKFVLQLGRLDASDYLDVYAMENPLSGFQNFVFTVNPTISVPNEGSLGIVAAAWVTEQVYAIAGFVDANGVQTQPGWDTFFGDREYFKHVEVGWTPSFERRYLDKIDVFYWHQDEREEAGVPSAWGLAFTASTFIDDVWMPFLRAGYSTNGVALLRNSVSIGIGRYDADERDLVGLGLNWGRATGSSRSQYIGELFYRLQLAQNLQITPSVQLVVNPVNNMDDDVIGVFGLRARLTF